MSDGIVMAAAATCCLYREQLGKKRGKVIAQYLPVKVMLYDSWRLPDLPKRSDWRCQNLGTAELNLTKKCL